MNRYYFNAINTGGLPSHCEKIARYWATLTGFQIGASGKARGMRYKAVIAFKEGLRQRGLPEPLVHQAYCDTLELVRTILTADNQ